MQEDARRLAEQVHALEDARSRWSAEVAAKEASLAGKEEALAADSRQRDAEQRRRLAQEHQVRLCTCTHGLGNVNMMSHRKMLSEWRSWSYIWAANARGNVGIMLHM